MTQNSVKKLQMETKSKRQHRTLVFVTLLILCAAMFASWYFWPVSDRLWAKRAVATSSILAMSKTDVDLKLGPPNNPPGFFSGWDYSYHLEQDWLGIDNWWLLIKIDENEKIVEANVVTD